MTYAAACRAINRRDTDWLRYYTWCEDNGKRWTWRGFAAWRKQDGKQLPLAPSEQR